MDFVDGPHITFVDPRLNTDEAAMVAQARSLVARFEKLGRDRHALIVTIPATAEGIAAAKRLRAEDNINVNASCVAGVVQAAACAEAGAACVTLPIAAMLDWNEARRGGAKDPYTSTNPGVELVQTIAAYFAMHDLPTTLLGAQLRHEYECCPLASLGAHSLDADQADRAERDRHFPAMAVEPSPAAVNKARSMPSPQKLRGSKSLFGEMNAEAFSAVAAALYSALGSMSVEMKAIDKIVKHEIRLQEELRKPLDQLPPTVRYVPGVDVKRRRGSVDEDMPPQKKARIAAVPGVSEKGAEAIIASLKNIFTPKAGPRIERKRGLRHPEGSKVPDDKRRGRGMKAPAREAPQGNVQWPKLEVAAGAMPGASHSLDPMDEVF
ncbi:aldolase [Artomyces pyxidatus]|uniref:Aldolase n=1 Tax=Artomyces pyxidatus TaxID=48021 RepID=A0ACB8SXZ8_9AGAM|nr:aldolase [Artomyces pyxidatus]